MATGLENLKIYQMARDLEIKVFKLTKNFPNDEKFLSVCQLRRSSTSVTNNIAEAYNKRTTKEKIRIYNDIAKCEANETRSNLEMCLLKEFFEGREIIDSYTELIKAISGYVRFIRNTEVLDL